MSWNVGQCVLGIQDDRTSNGGHDSDGLRDRSSAYWSTHAEKGTYANRDVFRSREEPVDEDTHEGGVETKLDWQLGQLSVSHSLRHHDGADCYTCIECSAIEAESGEENTVTDRPQDLRRAT